jgi:hypothetical protein
VLRNLDGEVADAAGGAVDQHALAGDDARLVDQTPAAPCRRRSAARRRRLSSIPSGMGSRRS